VNDLIQWAIVAFIAIGIFAAWRAGQANPESTGELAAKVSGLSTKVTTLTGRVGHVEDEVKELKEEAATKADVKGLERLVDEKFNTLGARMDGHQALSQATNHSVDRIERLLIERGLGK
jgi:hypothetical protein